MLAGELRQDIGDDVTIGGWLKRRRELKSVTFLVIRDRTGLAQVVLSPDLPCPATEETVLQVEGVVVANAQAPGGAEVTEPVLTPLSGPAVPPPFDLYRPALTATLPTILAHAPTTLRHPQLRA